MNDNKYIWSSWAVPVRDLIEQVKGLMIVKVDADSIGATITFENDQEMKLVLEGDCCSHSYFQDVKQFDELVDSVVLEIDEVSGPSSEAIEAIDTSDQECVSWHFLIFKTDRGHVTIDWRNDSNGYYDGTVNIGLSRLDGPAC